MGQAGQLDAQLAETREPHTEHWLKRQNRTQDTAFQRERLQALELICEAVKL
jgi:hypothetical protein